jgi:tripartite-type tricarboxylate transporter receptor subunit TctC
VHSRGQTRTMRSGFRLRMVATLASLAIFLTPMTVSAQEFPTGPIRMLVSHGIGGGSDRAARFMAPFLEEALGVRVIVENMEGAGGQRALDYVWRAEPDGYTIVVSASPARVITQLSQDTTYDLTQMTHFGAWEGGNFRVLTASAGHFASFDAFVEEARSRPVSYAGAGGYGSGSHLQFVLLENALDIDMRFIPYSGAGEAWAALFGGHVDLVSVPLVSAVPYMESGEIDILAVHAPNRIAVAPDVPTLAELGYPPLVMPAANGAWGPPGMPEERVRVIADAIYSIATSAEFQAAAAAQGILLDPMTGEEFLEMTVEQMDLIGAVIHLLDDED